MEKANKQLSKLHPAIAWIKKRVIKQNKNCIIVINGATGSGKTYAALSIAYQLSQELDTNFSIKENMDFNFSKFVEKTMLPINKKPGTCFVFEEVGATGGGASSREWQSKANILFNSFLQTTRHRNQILIMTCPYFSFLDISSRKLVHIQMDMKYINFKTKNAVAKPYFTQVNTRTGNIYFKLLRYIINNETIILNGWIIKHPPEHLVKEYEIEKEKFTDALNKKITTSLEGNGRYIPTSKLDDDIIDSLGKNGYTNQEIADKLSVSLRTIQRHSSKIKDNELDKKEDDNKRI